MIKLVRFRDLKERGIANSWAQLRNLQTDHGFPLGRMLGPNTRVWTEEEIDDWIAARPVAGPPPRGAAKAGRGRPRKAAAEADMSP